MIPERLVWLAGALVVSVALITLVRRNARRLGMMDLVTARSSHTTPVPRGGGIGFVVPATVAVAVIHSTAPELSLIAALTIALVATVGWRDDRVSLPIMTRLGVQAVAGLLVAGMALAAEVGGVGPATPAVVVFAWWTFWTVSCINVVNFLDGIDGLVAGQGLVFASFAALSSDDPVVVVPAVALMGGLLGFLAFNRPPASVFMGDVGSAGLGMIMVVIGLRLIEARGWTAIHTFLPLAPMFVDEVLTMGRRLRSGERLWRPHRGHIYQLAARAVGRHGPISAGYAALSLTGAVVALALPVPGRGFAVSVVVYLAVTAVALWSVRYAVEAREGRNE